MQSQSRSSRAPLALQGRSNSAFEVSIGSLDQPTLHVFAQYRPAELSVDQSVAWNEHTTRAGVWLEFAQKVSRGVAIELFLDATEEDVTSVMPWIEKLNRLANVRVPGSRINELNRPHHCILVYGEVFSNEMSFQCVIESLSTKYTRFSPTGVPIRAVVSVKLKEARWLEQPHLDPDYEPNHQGQLTSWERERATATAPSPRAPMPPEEDWSCE